MNHKIDRTIGVKGAIQYLMLKNKYKLFKVSELNKALLHEVHNEKVKEFQKIKQSISNKKLHNRGILCEKN